MLIVVSFLVFGLFAAASRLKGCERVDRDALKGLARLGGGSAKLLLLAGPLGWLADLAYHAAPIAQSQSAAWTGAAAWTLQVYFVISGIADVIHGIDRLWGGRSQEMVGAPLRADSFTSGWQRWNLAVKVLLPNSGHSVHAIVNLLVMAAIVSLAFGFSAAVLIWVGAHLMLLGIEHWRGRSMFAPLPLLLRVALTLFVVVITMPMLRADDPLAALDRVRRLFVPLKPTLYSVLLEARLDTPFFSMILITGSLLVLAGPRLAWLLELKAPKARLRHWACIATGVLALAMICVEIEPPAPRTVRAAVRHAVQRPLALLFGHGNRLVHVGHDGWLYPQRELDRLTLPSPQPGLAGGLLNLSAKLRHHEIPLLVIPVPSKAALLPEHILPAQYAGPAHGIGYRAAVERLRSAGIDVLDPADHLWSLKNRLPAYFKTDSHWTPEAMKEVAVLASRHIRRTWPHLTTDDTPPIRATIRDRSDAGNLARALDPWAPGSLFGVESTQLLSSRGMEPKAEAPVLLLGASLLGVYHQPDLSFGNPGGDAQHAGFATHLATLIGRPMDVREERDESLAATVGLLAADGRILAQKQLMVVLVQANDL